MYSQLLRKDENGALGKTIYVKYIAQNNRSHLISFELPLTVAKITGLTNYAKDFWSIWCKRFERKYAKSHSHPVVCKNYFYYYN